MRNVKAITVVAATLAIIVPAIIIARSPGPPPRRTGAPGDQTCATSTCHDGTLNPGEGLIRFTQLGPTYSPGVPIDFGIELQQVSAALHGFQATARLNSDSSAGQAGRWETAQAGTEVICENGSNRGTGSCPGTSPVEFIQHNQPQGSSRFDVRWAPPDSDVGPITIYAAVNGADGNGGRTGDQIFTAMAELTFQAAHAGPVIRDAQPVLQAFDNAERLSPGTHIQIFGENLSTTTRPWSAADFTPGVEPGGMAPTTLDGVTVSVNNTPAYVSFISPNQVNAVAPDGIGEGEMSVSISNAAGQSNNVTMTATNVSPAMQSDGRFVSGQTNYVVATHNPATNPPTFVGPTGLLEGANFQPAKPGDIITIYVVGAGTAEAYPAGQIPETAAPLETDFQVTIGNMMANAVAVANPQFVGVAQFNITVPNLTDGDHPITLTINSVDTGQTLFLHVMTPPA